MKKITLLVFSVFCMHLIVFSQSAVIQGKVVDSASQAAVEGVDVLLLAPKSNKPLYQTRTNNKGFTFKKVPEGSYGLVLLAMGFSNDTLVLSVKSGDTLRLNIVLRPQENELSGVVVKAAPRPVTMRGDTLSFNAAAYALRPDAQLEDLLRQLPGVEVDKDGNITYMGKRVDKIMINGQEFFIGGPRSAISLPAEIIASIEAFTTQSDAAKFSGIKENSGTRTLNIKTKKGMEEAWVGNVYGSKGRQKNYAAGGALTKLGKEFMLRVNLSANNINNRFTGVESKSTTPQTGVQSILSSDINLRKKFDNKLTANLSFNGSDQKTEVLEGSSRRTFLSDSSLQENRQGQRFTQDKKYPVNLKLVYNANDRNQWEFSSGFNLTRGVNNMQDTAAVLTLLNAAHGYTSSRVETRNTAALQAESFNNQVDWRHRFSRVGRTLQWAFKQSLQTGNSTGTLFSLLNGFSPTGALQQQTLTNQQYQQNNSTTQYGSTLTYTEPLSAKHSLLFSYKLNTGIQRNNRASYDFDSATGSYSKLNSVTSNQFENRNTTHYVEGGIGSNFRNLNYKMSLAWQYQLFDNLSFLPHRHVRQHFTNLLPKADVNITLPNGRSVMINYLGYSSVPTIDQLQPLPDLSNPLFIKTGNPDLKQAFQHSVFVMLNSVNKKNFNNLSLAVNGDFTRNQIVPAITLLPGGVQQQQFVNLNGYYNVGLSAIYGFGFAGKGGKRNNCNIQSMLSHGNEVNLINGQLNNASNFSWTENVRFSYSVGTRLITDFVAGTRFMLYRYSLSPQQNTRSWSHNATVNISYELPLGITLQTSYAWMHLGTSGLLPSQSSSLLNAAIYKRMFASRKWQLRFSAFDLLNSNRNFTQSAGQNYIYTQQTNQLQRMFLVSLLYDLKFVRAPR